MLTECINSRKVLFRSADKTCDLTRDRTDYILDVSNGFMLFRPLWATSSLWMLRIPLSQSLSFCGPTSTYSLLFQVPSSQKTACTYFLTVKPKCEAPSSPMRKWGKGMATGHHKLEPKTQFLCSGFKYTRQAKQLWGRSLSFCIWQRSLENPSHILRCRCLKKVIQELHGFWEQKQLLIRSALPLKKIKDQGFWIRI